ncbi:leucine-rich repeat-containing protein 42 [Synchiropus splendidus]|uniref:leucine-rich repeat-containing protein 42 n=1 Tax=Synchiropus splendidus TaxID=270530 RepID=UPI00237E1133|nr:leucine-rich repeat-containing protein 42 [Synchiropus splendidus]
MDSNTVYVRENGSLRRVSDIVLAPPRQVSSCRRTNPFVPKKEHFIFTYNAEGSLRYTTKSLFDITLLFVADNIQHVDSLVGFPEQIGDRVFAAVEENRVFMNPDVSPKALQLFNDAYGEMVLGSLCLRNRFPLFHERMDEMKTFHNLKCLDLFGCRLGDDHEIFPHLSSSSLASCLKQLFIGGNSLSDVGLQRLTAPIRMLKKGLQQLQFLDVSHNSISQRALRYLTCLPKLEKLDVSCTSVKLGAGLKSSMWNLLGLVHSEEALDVFDHSRCKTEGWAEQVVNQWEVSGTQVPKQKKLEESRISALRFFGRQRFVREVLNAAPAVCESTAQTTEETLHFCKPDHGTSATRTLPSNQEVERRGSGKRRRESCDRLSPPTKLSPAFTEEDLDLLNCY